jgi:hypothetical protein
MPCCCLLWQGLDIRPPKRSNGGASLIVVIVYEQSRRMRWVGHVACMEEMRNAYKIVNGKSEGKRPLRRPRHRWEDNITMDIRETGWKGVA